MRLTEKGRGALELADYIGGLVGKVTDVAAGGQAGRVVLRALLRELDQ